MDSTQVADRAGPNGIRRAARGPIAVAVAVLSIALIATVLAILPKQATYPADSPEATLQRYFEAYGSGDADAAYALLSPTVQRRTSRPWFDKVLRESHDRGPQRAWIQRVDEAGDRATITLIVEQDGGILGWGRHRDRHKVRMSLQDGTWRIDDPVIGLDHWYE